MAHDACEKAKAKGFDVLIVDTAGRLHVRANLMEELKKVVRVMGKLDEGAPHEVMLVLDAGTGQNALAQVRSFDGAIGVTGLVLTKLDGSARGGVVAAIADRVYVMYAGIIAEQGNTEQIFRNARHPYTQGLLASLPSLSKRGKRLYSIRMKFDLNLPTHYFRNFAN